METKEKAALLGNFSQTEKMPGLSWGVSSDACKTGAKLAKQIGTTCADCYTKRGRYVFGAVRAANDRRLAAWRAGKKAWSAWADNFASALADVDRAGYFRWFDTGDIQDLLMVRAIVRIAELLPTRRFWVPTQEHRLILRYIEDGGTIPENLTIRLSSREVDGPPPAIAVALGLPTSGTSRDPERVTCPASTQGNKCLTCRACWDRNVSRVIYPHKDGTRRKKGEI